MHSVIKKWKKKNNLFDCIVFLNEKELLKWQSSCKHVIKIPNFIPSQPYIDLLPKAISYLNEVSNKDLQNVLQNFKAESSYKDIQSFKQARFILQNFITHKFKLESKKIYKLIAVGRMDAVNNHKGFPRLIDAYSKIAHKFPSWQLEIIGQDQGQKKLLESQIESLKMKDYIVLKPFTTNIEQLYLEADIFVMSSHVESMPMVLIEAASYGLPIVAYDIGTIRDCFTLSPEIKNGLAYHKNGILVEDGNEKAFCKALCVLMESEENRIIMGQNGIKFAKDTFSKERVLKQWLELFKSLTHT